MSEKKDVKSMMTAFIFKNRKKEIIRGRAENNNIEKNTIKKNP